MDEAEALIERSHQAWAEFVTGDPRLALELYSHEDDAVIANPFVPYARGWEDASATIAQAAKNFRDGEAIEFERIATYAAQDLVCILEIERYRAKLGGNDVVTPFTLRVSTVLRREAGGWRIASRHADPITVPRTAASLAVEASHG